MSATAQVRIGCDHPGCVAYRSTTREDASVAAERVRAVSDGWDHFEGGDYCPKHRKDVKR